MQYEHVFSVVGAKAEPLAQTDLASAGFLERQHFQEWLLVNPQVLGATRASATALGGVSSAPHELLDLSVAFAKELPGRSTLVHPSSLREDRECHHLPHRRKKSVVSAN